MHSTVDDDVDHCCGAVVFYDDGANHALMLGIVAYAVFVVVDSRFVKRDGPHAIAEEPPRIVCRQAEGFRIVEIFACEACFPIDAVRPTVICEGHRFANLYGQL